MHLIEGRLRLAASDVANFLACPHLTRLDVLRAHGELQPPAPRDIGFEDLVARGEAHEQAVLGEFRASGWRIAEIPTAPGAAPAGAAAPGAAAAGVAAAGAAAAATLAAIRSGADVIYQGVLLGEPGPGEPALLGRPDFLVRAGLLPSPDEEPRPDGLHYEVVDAKLARSAKARAVAQTAFYSHLLAGLQGIRPRWMHLALGNKQLIPFKVEDYAAYERQARRYLATFIAAGPRDNPPSDPYPDPVEHCTICRWSDFCAARRRRDDDLSLVAGITRGQRQTLKSAGVATRRGFAALATLPAGTRASTDSLQRAQLQAQLQVASEDEGQIQYEILAPERDDTGQLVPNRGLLALPEPAPGDLFFDIEGARYYSEDGKEFGLQYLFGIVDTAGTDESGAARYRQWWAFDRAGEKRAFEQLIDFITERRHRQPGLHVYHYNHYEPTSVDHLTELHETRQEAVGRLMGRFATREDEVDNLLRLGVFVDLYRVVRQGLRAGVESYSIKRLEPLCGYARRMDLREATRNLIAFEAALEDGAAAGAAVPQRAVAAYNEDDCRATLALRDWLEQRRAELARHLRAELPRPGPGQESELTEDSEVTRIRAALLDGLPAEAERRSSEQNARALLADLLDWHRREAKPAWWRYFYVRTLSPQELTAEPDALGGLAGGEAVGSVKRSVLRRFTFPPQEHPFAAGDSACDPATGRGWTVWELDDEHGTIDLKVGRNYDGPLPAALVEEGPVRTDNLRARLRELGERVVREGVTGQDAATALLLRRPPAVGGPVPAGPLRRAGETAAAAAVRLAAGLHRSCLPIQGPPGSGKTHTAALQILALVQAGRTVGITGPSHAVISNLIGKVVQCAAEAGAPPPRIGQRPGPDGRFRHPSATAMTPASLARAIRDGDLDVAAGTAWLWAREEFTGSVDTLFVDEAGQVSLANTLAVAAAAGNLILLGDPQQLAQPSQAAHPPGAGVSPLEHILGDRATMPADAGLLIDRTWRMHPLLCSFTSSVFYDGKLSCIEGLERQEILGEEPPSGAGLRVVPVRHEANANASPEEACVVAQLAAGLAGRQWCDSELARRPVTASQILVVTPYNAHIRAIEDALAAAGGPAGVQVGTVDKFQGREAPVAIYSMATSSAGQAPRGLEFLYDPHRLNVATSRARAMAIIVASPDLLRVSCRTPRQMYLVNALCQAWETAQRQAG